MTMLRCWTLCGLLVLAGCGTGSSDESNAIEASTVAAKVPPSDAIKFKDEIDSNVDLPRSVDALVFTDTAGNRVRLEDYVGKSNVVLVFTEGFSGMLCPFCKTQTSRLVANYDQFVQRMAEVLVVYPGPREHLDEFVEAARTVDRKQVDRVPFPIVLDEDFKAVDFFNIRSEHALPSTYVINKAGDVALAYVGAGMTADRPSIKAILEKLDASNVTVNGL